MKLWRGSAGRMALAAVVVAALAAVPLLTARKDVLNFLFLFFLFSALAQSWNILAGYGGQVSLGHAAFFGLGALTTRMLWVGGTPLALSLPAGGLVALAVALTVGYPAFRLRGIYFSIGTLALGEILRVTVGNLLPTVTAMPGPYLASYSLVSRYYLALGLAAFVCLAAYLLVASRWGMGLLAVREDEAAAASSGVNVFGHKLLALGLSSLCAGLTGGLFAYYHVSYYYFLPFNVVWTFDAMLITFVGGVGTLTGPVLGALFFVLVRDMLALRFTELHLIIFGVLFIVVVLLVPGGLAQIASRLGRFRLGRAKT